MNAYQKSLLKSILSSEIERLKWLLKSSKWSKEEAFKIKRGIQEIKELQETLLSY